MTGSIMFFLFRLSNSLSFAEFSMSCGYLKTNKLLMEIINYVSQTHECFGYSSISLPK